MKRVVVMSDLHCGHQSGLTPPDFQFRETEKNRRGKYAVMQREMWDWYASSISRLGPIDTLVVNGDALDGKGEKSGSTELVTADPEEQVEMARLCIEQAQAQKVVMSYGTPYHVGRETDYEAMLAKQLNAEIHSHPFVDAEGVIFDCKHKVSSSIIPYGRHTAPARERMWNILWNERGLQPKGRVFIRSHVHYFTFAGDQLGLVITTPALQGPGTKFGARMCSGTVDVGFLVFECEDGCYKWEAKLSDMQYTLQEAIPA